MSDVAQFSLAELSAWSQEPRWWRPQTTGFPLTMGLPEGQMLPGRIDAQSVVGLPSSWVQVEHWWAVTQAIFHSGVPCVPG